MIRACLRALLSHWWRNPLQLFALFAGLALATSLWTGVQAINSEARASYDAAAQTLGQGRYDLLVPQQGDTLPQQTYIDLRLSGWLVSPMIEGRLNGVRLVGFDVLTAPDGMGTSEMNTAPAPDTAAGALFANAEAARALEGKVDMRIDPSIGPGLAIGDIGTVQRLLNREDLSQLIVLPTQPLGRPDLADVAPDLRLQASNQAANVAELTDSFHLNLTAFGFLSFAVGLFIVQSTIGLAFEQRRAMIRTLRSLGIPLRFLILMIIAEMLSIAVIGAVLGIGLGYLIAAFLLPDVAVTLRGLYGAEVAQTLTFRAEWWLSGLLISLLGASAALSVRLWQVWHMPILASARPRAWLGAGSRRFKWLTGLAALLLGTAALLTFFASGLITGFVLLGCLLIGAALALPAIFSQALSLAEGRTRSQLVRWFCADTRQQLPGLSLALMALLLAVSANIGVTTMVSSFRLTFSGFLDQRLAPELFIEVETPTQSADLQRFLSENAIETLPLMTSEVTVAGQPSRHFGVRVGPTYREDWVFLDAEPDAWDRVDAGMAVVLNEQLARRVGLWIGDPVEIVPSLTLPIAAIVADYGNPNGQVISSERIFLDIYPRTVPLRFGIRTDDPDQTRSWIIEELNLPRNAMINQAAIKTMSMQVFERTFTVTHALNILTLSVAGFAMLMSLLTLADLRLPQLAPVWAMGLTRRALGWLELARAIAMAGVVFVCALPLGLALAWVLLSIINVEAFGWRLPMFLFFGEYAKLGGYTITAAILAAAWPAWRMMRLPPSALLKVFANER